MEKEAMASYPAIGKYTSDEPQIVPETGTINHLYIKAGVTGYSIEIEPLIQVKAGQEIIIQPPIVLRDKKPIRRWWFWISR
jgi:hypothetical protein